MDTKKVCPDCLDENYFLCPICQTYHPNNEKEDDDDYETICEYCYQIKEMAPILRRTFL